MKIDIYDDGISYVTDEVSTVSANGANVNEENRIKFVTDLAAISRGNYESKNPEVRYKKLLKEAAPNINIVVNGHNVKAVHVSPQEYYSNEWENIDDVIRSN